ncbi:unnamed protein product [Enterobius vermicularis]|uniref:RT_RNaseH_2 domain-containing protein n=1 Tax=Enterobius vermicularis TaxID=51028 RepID=A0A0N4USN6_ENTVE|nr:unnamed protein product [Enterobius vermicularis]
MKCVNEGPDLLKDHNKILKDQLKQGIIETVRKSGAEVIQYLLQNPVLTPKKNTIRLWIVHDASTKWIVGTWLNEVIYRGPVIPPQLSGIQLRTRSVSVTAVGAGEKMFLQIAHNPDGQVVTRLLG